MFPSIFSARVLALSAFLLTAMLPLLAATWGQPPSGSQHAQMMASAGHTMPMETSGLTDDARMLLCQQHCLLAAATLPAQVPVVNRGVATSDIVVTADRVGTSLAIPPPGPPPKVAMV